MSQVLSGTPGNRVSDKKGMIAVLDNMVYDYVVSKNMLGGCVTDASIATTATDAYKAMVKAGRVDVVVYFKASAGSVHGFKCRFNLRLFLRCGEFASADADGV